MVCLMSGAALPEWGADGAIGEESGGRSRISGKGEASAPTGFAHPAGDSGVTVLPETPAGAFSPKAGRLGSGRPAIEGDPIGCHDVAERANRARRSAHTWQWL